MNIQMRRARHRQMFIFLLVCLGIFMLLARLYYWQILQSQNGYKLAQRANDEHIKNLILDAPRGLIYDINGKLLATNVLRDDVYVEPLQFTLDHSNAAQSDLETLITTLHQVLPKVSVEKLHQAFASGQYTARIAIGIDPSQSEQLRNLQLPDVFLEPRTWRIYPGGSLAAQIMGFVTQYDSDNHGNYGIEGMYDALLEGKPGSFTAVKDLQGNPLDVGSINEQPPVSGADLTLTIDSTVEYMVSTALADTVKNLQARSGTVVVVNAHTGAIVAMAGEPSFDPNHYGQYASLKGCLGREEVYFNPALYCGYEPGSTMKLVTMAAALDQRLITPDTTFNDPGCMTFADAPEVCNWEYKAYGTESMTQVLLHSANVGAAHVAHDILGADRYYPYLARFGFGQRTNIDGPEETGVYLSPNDQNWTLSDLTRQAFGQSILATPIQVAMAYEAVANGGVMMYPYLVTKIDKNGKVMITQPKVERHVISTHAAQLLTGMLTQAAQYGSAELAQVPGYSIAAKTGTATTQGISADQTEASVAGFIPASNPQFVILVKIDRPQKAIYGSTAAAPLWKMIAQQLMWYYAVPPDLPQ
ncbi:MAG TPA: penicillin-binding protein 2 [Ktedonobacteraceae bacterium]|nr:penicillin-binding protein 2 [Ktedonobacteraceae bacterium]